MTVSVKLDDIIEGLEAQSDESYAFLSNGAKKTISSLKRSSMKDFSQRQSCSSAARFTSCSFHIPFASSYGSPCSSPKHRMEPASQVRKCLSNQRHMSNHLDKKQQQRA